MRHIMSPLDFSVEELDQLLNLANDIEANPKKYAHACEGKKLATLFYEPSTRTRLSFEAAMMNLGGNVLGFFFGRFQLRYKRRDRCRHHSHGRMLCRHLCNASSKRRCTACGILTFSNPGDQCRRWRTSASDPDTYGSSDDPLPERKTGQSDDRSLW